MRKCSPLSCSLTACTPAEARHWWSVYQEHPVGAARFAKCVTARPKAWHHPGHVRHECRVLGRRAQIEWNEANARWVPDTSCSQWAQTALDAGFSKDEWYEPVARIMAAESGCSPSAYNSQEHFGGHACGLMQVIWPTWSVECGNGDIFDPYFNL